VLVGRNRRGATVNMQRILGDVNQSRARRAALRMFAAFAHCFTETMEYYGPRPQPIRIDLPEPECDELAKALKHGHGAVVVTGHFGNWDVAAKGLCAYGRPVNLVMAREVNASTNEYVRQAREAAGVQVIYSNSSVFSSLNMVRALRRNEVVAMQLDRPMDADGVRLVRFFGAPAPFPSGPFVLARVAGVPLIPVFVPRLGTRHYAIRVGGRFDVAREARDSRALDRVMAEVAQAFEAIVREFPMQWFQFTPFWPGDEAQIEVAPPMNDDASTERRRAQR
jgi:KDO2-lipid IV(A) lauroyltransferase